MPINWISTGVSIISVAVICSAARSAVAQQPNENAAPAYYIAEFELKDAAAFAPYHRGVPDTVARYGGTYMVRGGKADALAGPAPKRMIIMRFPSLAAAHRWYDSPEYSELRPHRQRSGETRNFIVEGFVDKLPD